MQRKDVEILPLYFFFERLRQHGFSLGVGDYQALLKSINLQYGLSINDYPVFLQSLHSGNSLQNEHNLFPAANLLRICKLLWLKPNQSSQLFEELFEASYVLDFRHFGVMKDAAPPLLQNTPVINEVTSTELSGKPKDADVTPVSEPQIVNSIEEDDQVSVRIHVGKYKSHPQFHMGNNEEADREKSKFLFTENYYPIDRRKIQQNLRLFPGLRKAYSSSQVDIHNTIKKAIDKGYFNEVEWKKYKRNSVKLLLLIDKDDSMVAFSHLSELLKIEFENIFDKGEKSERLFQTFYYYNSASNNFFKNKSLTKSVDTNKVLQNFTAKQTAIIIISDAGATQDRLHKDRVDAARLLLGKLQKSTRRIIILNPLPKERWENNAAKEISKLVAMFEATENGIKNAIDFLKGTSPKIIQSL